MREFQLFSPFRLKACVNDAYVFIYKSPSSVLFYAGLCCVYVVFVFFPHWRVKTDQNNCLNGQIDVLKSLGASIGRNFFSETTAGAADSSSRGLPWCRLHSVGHTLISYTCQAVKPEVQKAEPGHLLLTHAPKCWGKQANELTKRKLRPSLQLASRRRRRPELGTGCRAAAHQLSLSGWRP